MYECFHVEVVKIDSGGVERKIDPHVSIYMYVYIYTYIHYTFHVGVSHVFYNVFLRTSQPTEFELWGLGTPGTL